MGLIARARALPQNPFISRAGTFIGVTWMIIFPISILDSISASPEAPSPFLYIPVVMVPVICAVAIASMLFFSLAQGMASECETMLGKVFTWIYVFVVTKFILVVFLVYWTYKMIAWEFTN